jgi:DNA repair photolyase
MRTTEEKWHAYAVPRQDILKNFEKDAAELRGDSRRILFCFVSDPYQPLERELRLTRQVLHISAKYKLKSQVLTKGCADLILEDLGLMKRAHTQLGITLCFVDDKLRRKWEPNASAVQERLNVLKSAHKAGVFTWVSLEPVIDPAQALEVVRMAHPYVDFWKVGKLNHMKKYERAVNWRKFLHDVEFLFSKLNVPYYVKKDLRNFAVKQ